MSIITLTTDLGREGHYASALKGAVWKAVPDARLVDISHDIGQHDIVQAAYILRQTWAHYPSGSLHLASTYVFYAEKVRFLLALHEGHYFLLPDNGLLSLLLDDAPESIRALAVPHGDTFPQLRLLPQAARHLAEGRPFHELGEAAGHYNTRLALQPVVNRAQLRGTVIHIDHYGNVIINITRQIFERAAAGRRFELYFRRFDPITRISDSYQDVPLGDTLCLFNTAGFLEIAINTGPAASLLGLGMDDTIQIHFLD